MRLGLLALLGGLLCAQSSGDRWAPVSFLIGEWTGEGGGGPGQGSGGFSFLPDQGDTVLVRKNRADYPATKDKPAFTHTDLMIVYREAGESTLRAIYFDSEDHVIHYTVEPSDSGVRFVGEISAKNPRYRLTYRKTGNDSIAILFEMAPPGKPDAYTKYIEATARRVQRSK